MEVAGLVLGALPLVVNTLEMYQHVIGYTDAYKSAFYSHKLRQERATFETIVQLLSKSDSADSSTSYLDAALPLLLKVANSLKKANKISLSMNENPSSTPKVVRWVLRDRRELESQIEQISAYNSELRLLVDQMTHGAAPRQVVTQEELISTTLDSIRFHSGILNTAGSSTNSDFPRRKGELLQQLVSSCDSLLLLITEDQPKFTDAFNKFRLWELDVKSEGLYKALDFSPQRTPGSQRGSTVTILFRSVVRVIKVCTWVTQEVPYIDSPKWQRAMKLCTDSSQAACREIPWLADVNAKDLEMAHDVTGGSASIALTTIELVVHTLQSCLPATTRISRQYSMQSEDMRASDVTRLLDISVTLIDPVRKAFSQAAELHTAKSSTEDPGKGPENDETQGGENNAPLVDLESIRPVFDKQAEALQNWKTKHMEDIELKLARNNPAKLASIADSVQNIVTTLSKVQGMMKDPGSLSRNKQELEGSMKAFETFVQSLVAVGTQLDETEAPPPYQSISKDRVVISLTGERVPAPTYLEA